MGQKNGWRWNGQASGVMPTPPVNWLRMTSKMDIVTWWKLMERLSVHLRWFPAWMPTRISYRENGSQKGKTSWQPYEWQLIPEKKEKGTAKWLSSISRRSQDKVNSPVSKSQHIRSTNKCKSFYWQTVSHIVVTLKCEQNYMLTNY